MATILFMIDIEEGHLFPSFALAHRYKKEGHRVVYASVPDNGKFIIREGFEFCPLFEKHYPEGFREKYKQQKKAAGMNRTDTVASHLGDLMLPSFNEFLWRIGPDLIVMSCFLSIESLLLYYRSKIRPVLLRPFLREPGADAAGDCIRDLMNLPPDSAMELFDFFSNLGYSFTSFAEIVNPLKSFHELVACPEQFEMPGYRREENTCYLGPGFDRQKAQEPFAFPDLNGKKLLYASMGSQALVYGDRFRNFFNGLMEVMARPSMKDFHLIIATGQDNAANGFSSQLPGVTVVQWAPQHAILSKAAIALIHGGLGSVKECICSGVPMIVFPVTHDQPSNAKRIEHHQLGIALPSDVISPDRIEQAILNIIRNETIQENIRRMQHIFLQADEEKRGLEILSQLLPQKGLTV